MNETRPDIETIKSATELKRWYWLKEELIAQAKQYGLKTTGAKFKLLDRLAHYLETGEKQFPGDAMAPKTSKFDWSSANLMPETIITDNYKNSQNVRHFFKRHCGDDFKFNIAFMDWIKSNAGKTLGDAVSEWNAQKKRMSSDGFKTDILSHNQFNQYTRDFLADNPDLGMNDVRRVWAKKRALPSETGRHKYERSDLALK